MNELQDAIKRLDTWEKWQEEATYSERLVWEAARRVVNLYDAIDPKQLNDALKFAHVTDSDAEYLIVIAQQVQVTLGITEPVQ